MELLAGGERTASLRPGARVEERVNELEVWARQRDDPDSMLALTHRLIDLRRGSRALEVGDFSPVGAHGDVLAYLRHLGDERFLVAEQTVTVEVSKSSLRSSRIVP